MRRAVRLALGRGRCVRGRADAPAPRRRSSRSMIGARGRARPTRPTVGRSFHRILVCVARAPRPRRRGGSRRGAAGSRPGGRCTAGSPGSPGPPTSPMRRGRPGGGCAPGRGRWGRGCRRGSVPRRWRRSRAPAMYSSKMRCTTGAATGSSSSRCSRLPSAALPGFGCGPASASRYPYGGRPPRNRPSSAAWAPIADRTRILIRFRSPFDIPPKSVITRSWASEPGSIGPPTSGTHSCDAVVANTGNVSPNWLP